MSHSFGTLDLKHLNGDSDDDDDDLENEEERREELQRRLSEAFEDMSSIDDEDDDEDTPEEPRCAPALKSLPTTPTGVIQSPRTLGSAERLKLNGLFNGHINSLPVIEDEGDLVDDDNNNDSKMNESHIRLLLADNENLSRELDKLKRQLDINQGDFEGLSFKYRQLEDQLNLRNKEVAELQGKLAAEKITSEDFMKAHRESQGKAAVYEETITALRQQLADLTRSDCVERLRQSYESQIKRLKEQAENDQVKWMDERDRLNEKIEEKDHRIARLKLELSIRPSKIPVKSPQDNRSHQPSESFQQLKSELDFHVSDSKAKQAEINSLTDEIADLKEVVTNKNREIKLLEQDLSIKGQQLQMTSDTIDVMKDRIEKLMDDNAILDRKIEELRKDGPGPDWIPKSQLSSLAAAATEKWRKEIEETYKKSFTEEVNTLRAQMAAEKAKITEAIDYDVSQIQTWIKNITSSDGSRPSSPQVSNLLDPLIRLWRTIEVRHEEQLEILKDRQLKVEEAVKELEEAYNMSRSDHHSERRLKDFDDDGQNVTEEQARLLDQARMELDEARQDALRFKHKLDKYKKHTIDLKTKFDREQELLKMEFASILRKKLMDMKEKEESLKDKISQDSQKLIQSINQAYVQSIKSLKDETDHYLLKTNSRSLDKMAMAIVKYHELVMSRVDQRRKKLQSHLDVHHTTSIHDVDDEVSVIHSIPPLTLH